MSWWVIDEPELRDMLVRCHEGEDPELVLAEEYANAEIAQVGPRWRRALRALRFWWQQ